jgi:hypothetical protein
MLEQVKGHKCSCCFMSRRSFMATLSTAAVGMTLLSRGGRGAYAQDGLGDYIDLAKLRPQPNVKIMYSVVREKPPYWLGWPGTSYDLEGERQRYYDAFKESADKLGVALIQKPEALEDDPAVAAYVAQIQAEKPDAVLIMLQHLGSWGKADAISKAGVPTIIFAPVGTAFTGQVLEISRRPGVHVVSSLEVAGVTQAMRMIRAKKQFEATKLMVVAGKDRSESQLERLGTKVKNIPRDRLHEIFEKMPETEEAREVAESMFTGADNVIEPTKVDGLNAARSYMAAKRLLVEEECNALTSDCLGMVTERKVPTPPCMAACIFQDAGVTYGCEADVMGALSLMLPSYLLDKPGFMNDPVPETVKNHLIVAHCVCGTKLNGFEEAHEPYVIRSHSESALGVSLQVLWREEQPATLVRFQSPNEIIVDTGTVVTNVNTPPAGGCRTNLELRMDDIEDVRDVLGFHQVVFYGDHRRDVQAFAQLMGIKVIHSPEHAPEPKTS